MLIRDIDEIRNFLPVSTASNVKSIVGLIPMVEAKYIIPEIGKEFYLELQEQYDDNTFNSDEFEKVHELIQRAITYYVYYLYIPVGQLHISDAGFRIAVDDHFKTAFDHQIDRLEDSFLDAGDMSMDMVMDYLEENKGTFTTWASSSAFTQFKERFISTTAMLNNELSINISRRKFKKLKKELRKVEQEYILSTVGAELYDQLHTQSSSNTISSENKKLMEYIYPACASIAMANGAVALMLTVDDMGVSTTTNSIMKQRIKQPANDNVLANFINKLKQDGKDEVKKLQQFLYDNADAYELFKSSSAYNANRTTSIDNSQFNGIYVA